MNKIPYLHTHIVQCGDYICDINYTPPWLEMAPKSTVGRNRNVARGRKEPHTLRVLANGCELLNSLTTFSYGRRFEDLCFACLIITG